MHAAAPQRDGHDIRDASVRELQRRFSVDIAAGRAGRARSPRALLRRASQPARRREARRELRWACALHEIGMMVSHHDHHRHSAYLLGARRRGRASRRASCAASATSCSASAAACARSRRGLPGRRLRAGRCSACAWRDRTAMRARRRRRRRSALRARRRRCRGSRSRRAGPRRHPRTLHLLREEVEAWDRIGRSLQRWRLVAACGERRRRRRVLQAVRRLHRLQHAPAPSPSRSRWRSHQTRAPS